jgi:Flp pilus assembly protein TadG
MRTALWRRRFRAFWKDDDGQMLPFVAVLMVAMLGMAGLAVDVGHAYLCQRELQASCDAAALAGAAVIPTSSMTSTVISTATNYSSTSNAKNSYGNLSSVTMVAGYPALKCLSTMQTQGISCVGYLPYNALQVKQRAVVPMYFAKLFGMSTMTVGASSTAAKGGGSSRPYNIAIMLDTTLSMTYYDSDCGNTQMQCSLNGVQVLLRYLDPCGFSQQTCTFTAGNAANSVVRVSLFTFPQLQYPTVRYDSDCSNSVATSTSYTFPPIGGTSYMPGTYNNSTTYRIVDFQSDYRVSDTATALNSSSLLTTAAGGSPGCAGMNTPNNAGYYGTYYAATMYAAQAALIQERTANPGSENVLIILGDGDANAPQYNPPGNPNGIQVMPYPASGTGLYPSYYGECGQAIDAAAFATGQGTTVYTVAYGSPSSGCTTDQSGSHAAGTHPNISPCNEMAAMASHSWDFFSDYKQTGADTSCVAAQTMVSLNNIFLQIAGDLTVARLIPDNTT